MAENRCGDDCSQDFANRLETLFDLSETARSGISESSNGCLNPFVINGPTHENVNRDNQEAFSSGEEYLSGSSVMSEFVFRKFFSE